MPTLHQLRIFAEVARNGKMSDAAQKLYLSQPTVSQAISTIESHYNVKLFERLSKKLYLTDEGKTLLEETKLLLAQYEHLDDRMKEINHTYSLRLGASATIGVYLAHRTVDSLYRELQNVKLKIFSYSAKYIESALSSNALDAALVEYKMDIPDMISTPMFDDHLSLVCGREHPFFRRDSVDISELNGQSFVIQEVSGTSGQILRSFLRDFKIKYECDWVCNNIESTKAAVINNRGLTLISDFLTETECLYRILNRIPINGHSFHRKIYLVYHKDKYLSAPMKKLIQICSDY